MTKVGLTTKNPESQEELKVCTYGNRVSGSHLDVRLRGVKVIQVNKISHSDDYHHGDKECSSLINTAERHLKAHFIQHFIKTASNTQYTCWTAKTHEGTPNMHGTLKFNTETECDTESIGSQAECRRVMEKGLPMPNLNTSLLVQDRELFRGDHF